MSALACGAIGMAAVYAAYSSKGDGSLFFWLLAVFALIGAANS